MIAVATYFNTYTHHARLPTTRAEPANLHEIRSTFASPFENTHLFLPLHSRSSPRRSRASRVVFDLSLQLIVSGKSLANVSTRVPPSFVKAAHLLLGDVLLSGIANAIISLTVSLFLMMQCSMVASKEENCKARRNLKQKRNLDIFFCLIFFSCDT